MLIVIVFIATWATPLGTREIRRDKAIHPGAYQGDCLASRNYIAFLVR